MSSRKERRTSPPNGRRAEQGAGPLPRTLDIIPHHESPITQRNQDAADVGNLRARLAVAMIDLGVTPAPAMEVLEYEPGVQPRELRHRAEH